MRPIGGGHRRHEQVGERIGIPAQAHLSRKVDTEKTERFTPGKAPGLKWGERSGAVGAVFRPAPGCGAQGT